MKASELRDVLMFLISKYGDKDVQFFTSTCEVYDIGTVRDIAEQGFWIIDAKVPESALSRDE